MQNAKFPLRDVDVNITGLRDAASWTRQDSQVKGLRENIKANSQFMKTERVHDA